MATVPGPSEGAGTNTMEMVVYGRKNLAWQKPTCQRGESSVSGGKPGFSGERLWVSGALLTMEWIPGVTEGKRGRRRRRSGPE